MATQLDHSAGPWPGLPATERVATFLEDFAKRADAGNISADACVSLPMTRAQLGSYLGLAEETLVRALTQLREDERLDVDGRCVRFLTRLQ